MNKKSSALQNLALISQVGISMVIPIIMSLYIGKWLDDKFGTGPVFLFIFIIMGIISAFISVFKLTQKEFGHKKGK